LDSTPERRPLKVFALGENAMAADAPFRTPDADSASVQAFASELRPGARAISVPMFSRQGPLGNCYWNVDAAVKDRGGAMQLGWLMTELADSHIDAMHHAVWMRAPGMLLDVTQKYPDDPVKTHSTFVCDDTIKIDLHRVAPVKTRNKILKDRPELQRYLTAYDEMHAAEDAVNLALWKEGYRAEGNFRKAAGQQPIGYPISPDMRDLRDLVLALEEAKRIRAVRELELTAAIKRGS
jgi:hypothetical protein